MSSHLEIHVGVYLQMEIDKVPSIPSYSCPAHPNKKFWQTEATYWYCQECGCYLQQDETTFELPHISDLLPENEYEFMQITLENSEEDNYLILLSNGKDGTYIDTENNAKIEITPTTIEHCITNFMATHQQSLAKLKKISKKIEIKFGVIQYYL